MALTANVSIEYYAPGSSFGRSGTAHKYTIKRGDSMWRIAESQLGDGKRWKELYELNADIIEKAARDHGKAKSINGQYLYEGTVIIIPGAETVASDPKGSNISNSLTAFSYTDVASGQADSVSMTLTNIQKEWLGAAMPVKGSSVRAAISTSEWGQGSALLDCGVFIVDDILFTGRPLECVLGAVSVPEDSDFKTRKKTVTWQATTLVDMASQIAGNAGVELYYSGDNIQIPEIEQSGQTDSSFLYELCEKYGFSMKVFNRKIVIFDTAVAERQDAVATIDESDMSKWSYNSTIEGTYTGIEFTYSDPDSSNVDRTISVSIGKEGRMYYVNAQAAGEYDAELQATALLRKANREMETMSVSIRANNIIYAGQCVNITGLGNANGKYYVDQIKHSIGSGYTMQLTLHKVQSDGDGTVTTSSSTTAKKESKIVSYVIQRGDTLWLIAQKYLGDGKRYKEIYYDNLEVIEAAARAKGKPKSVNGQILVPGTIITIRTEG